MTRALAILLLFPTIAWADVYAQVGAGVAWGNVHSWWCSVPLKKCALRDEAAPQVSVEVGVRRDRVSVYAAHISDPTEGDDAGVSSVGVKMEWSWK